MARYNVNLNTNSIKINFKCYFYFLSFIKFYKNAIISSDKKFYNTHNYGGENVYIKQSVVIQSNCSKLHNFIGMKIWF